MSFLSKVELKKQLFEMGIKVEGNYVKKKDLQQYSVESESKLVKKIKVGNDVAG